MDTFGCQIPQRTRDSYLVAKGLTVIGLMVGMSLLLSYGIAVRDDPSFKVRDLLREDYLPVRKRREVLSDTQSTTEDWWETNPMTPPFGSYESTGTARSPFDAYEPTDVTTDASPLVDDWMDMNQPEVTSSSPFDTGATTASAPPPSNAVANLTETTDNGTTTADPTTTDTPTTAPSTAIPTLPPTTTPPPAPCFRQDYQLQDACELDANMTAKYGVNVTLEDVYNMLFIQRYLDRLQRVCEPGQWCLPDDWDLATDNLDFLDFCVVGTCLISNIPDDCLDEKRMLIQSTLLMLCDVIEENVTDVCFVAVRKMTHVSRVQQLDAAEPTRDVCDGTYPMANCTGACHNYAAGLYCMHTLCNQSMEQFKQYSSWRWYFDESEDDMFDFCELNNTDCRALGTADSWLNTFWNNINNIEYIRQMDGRVMAGIVVAVLFALGGLTISLYACAKKSGMLRYSREVVEYHTVESLDDEDYDSS